MPVKRDLVQCWVPFLDQWLYQQTEYAFMGFRKSLNDGRSTAASCKNNCLGGFQLTWYHRPCVYLWDGNVRVLPCSPEGRSNSKAKKRGTFDEGSLLAGWCKGHTPLSKIWCSYECISKVHNFQSLATTVLLWVVVAAVYCPVKPKWHNSKFFVNWVSGSMGTGMATSSYRPPWLTWQHRISWCL